MTDTTYQTVDREPRPGDPVRCIDNKGAEARLERGEIYTVTNYNPNAWGGTDGGGVHLAEVPAPRGADIQGHFGSRFEVVEKVPAEKIEEEEPAFRWAKVLDNRPCDGTDEPFPAGLRLHHDGFHPIVDRKAPAYLFDRGDRRSHDPGAALELAVERYRDRGNAQEVWKVSPATLNTGDLWLIRDAD